MKPARRHRTPRRHRWARTPPYVTLQREPAPRRALAMLPPRSAHFTLWHGTIRPTFSTKRTNEIEWNGSSPGAAAPARARRGEREDVRRQCHLGRRRVEHLEEAVQIVARVAGQAQSAPVLGALLEDRDDRFVVRVDQRRHAGGKRISHGCIVRTFGANGVARSGRQTTAYSASLLQRADRPSIGPRRA